MKFNEQYCSFTHGLGWYDILFNYTQHSCDHVMMHAVNGNQTSTGPEMTSDLAYLFRGQCLVRNGRDYCRPTTDFAVPLLW